MVIAKGDLIEGLAKGLAALESFDTERQRLIATLAANRAGLSRAAARRQLLNLTHLGYLQTDGSHHWLSPRVLRFSGSYLASARLPRLLQPKLNRLATQTREWFSAVVLDEREVVIVARSAVFEAAAVRESPSLLRSFGARCSAPSALNQLCDQRTCAPTIAQSQRATQSPQWQRAQTPP